MRTCTCNAVMLIITFSFWEIKVFYKKVVGAGTAVKETPEIERVKKNQQNISSVSIINSDYSYVSKQWSDFFFFIFFTKNSMSSCHVSHSITISLDFRYNAPF